MGNCITGLVSPAEEFDFARDAEGGKGGQLVKMSEVVHTKQMYVRALIWINILLSLASLFIDLVPGAARGGAPVSYRAMPHIVWQVANLGALLVALDSISLDVRIDIDGMQTTLIVAFVFMLISALINIVHLIGLIMESIDNTSIFAINGYPFLITLTVGVGVFVLWQAWIAARLWVFRSTVANAISQGWAPGAAAVEYYKSQANGPYSKLPEPEPPATPLLTTTTTTTATMPVLPSAAATAAPVLSNIGRRHNGNHMHSHNQQHHHQQQHVGSVYVVGGSAAVPVGHKTN